MCAACIAAVSQRQFGLMKSAATFGASRSFRPTNTMPILTKRKQYARVPTGKRGTVKACLDKQYVWFNLEPGGIVRIDLVFSSFYSLSRRPKNEATLIRAVQAVQAVHINDEGDEKVYTRKKGMGEGKGENPGARCK